jgi:hypothetical protein
MTDLRTLRDAFDELERRADAAPESAPVPGRSGSSHRRLLAPSAAALTVAATAAAVLLWQQAGSNSPPRQPAAGSGHPSTVSEPATPPSGTGEYQPPDTGAELTARTRAILDGIATIEVTYESPEATTGPSVAGRAVVIKGGHRSTVVAITGAPGAGSGSAIVGTLTAAGRSGGFDLDVFAASPGSTATCDEDTNCSMQTRPDGSSFAIGVWHDPTVPGGLTYQIEVVRPDGADILFHLSTERDPKGQSAVTAERLPLTVAQMTDFVTSDRW